MQLEDYFEFDKFASPFGPFERIRIKGHRIAIEHVLRFYKEGLEPEEIVKVHYPSLTQEEVQATINYYLHNQAAVDHYLQEGERIADAWYNEYLERGPFFLRDDAAKLRNSRPTGTPPQ